MEASHGKDAFFRRQKINLELQIETRHQITQSISVGKELSLGQKGMESHEKSSPF